MQIGKEVAYFAAELAGIHLRVCSNAANKECAVTLPADGHQGLFVVSDASREYVQDSRGQGQAPSVAESTGQTQGLRRATKCAQGCR